jgi:hypothetical protein
MKERPILFNGEMVRAILDGRKTQTRRIVKPTNDKNFSAPGFPCELSPSEIAGEVNAGNLSNSHYGKVGDRLWVRETFSEWDDGITYAATCTHAERSLSKFKPSIHMPRRASRITLEITGARVERLQDIDEDGAKAEGVTISVDGLFNHREEFYSLWQSIYKNWDENPWVWVIEFKKI